MRMRVSFYVTAAVLLTILVVATGCSKAPTDAQIASDVQSQLNADSGLQGKALSVQSASGTVTLSGTVDNENQRTAAARYASSVPGVKQVVNNLQVTPPPPHEVAMAVPAPQAKPKAQASKPRARTLPSSSSTSIPAPVTPSPTPVAATAPMPSTPPPAPKPVKVTIPSGTTLAIRLVDGVNSETATQGQTFNATLNSPLSVDGDVVIPSGYNVEGHVVEVKSAGKFAGQSVLKLQLDRIAVGSKSYSIQTDQYSRQGSSRTKNTVAKVGAGAAIGAIIGGIAAGGKGAAIGAAAGGGVGGGVQAATKGQQIDLPSETVLNFTLQAALTVVPAHGGPNEGRPRLERRPNPNPNPDPSVTQDQNQSQNPTQDQSKNPDPDPNQNPN